MNPLDVRTILLSTVLVMAVCAAVLGSLWRQSRARVAGTGHWFADGLLQLAAVLLIALRGTVPVAVSVMLGTPLMVAGVLLLVRGLERYRAVRSPWLPGALLLAAVTGLQAVFTFLHPSLLARNILLSAVLLATCTRAAWILLRTGAGHEARAGGIVFVAYAVFSALRIAADLAVDPGQDLLRSGLHDSLVLLAYQVLFIGLTVSLLLMVNRRLGREQDRTVAALRESEDKFSRAFRSAPHGLTITREGDGKLLEVNDAFCEITGISRAEALASGTVALHLWADPAQRGGLLAALRSEQRVRNLELEFRAANGVPITALLSAETIAIEGERCIIASVADISARVRAERQAAARARQHAAIADLGAFALGGADLAAVMDLAVRRAAEALGVELAKVLELQPDGRTLLLRAGVGWHPGLVGTATVDGGTRSQAGFTLQSREPVIVDDLAAETRFSGPALLGEHGVVSGISVVIGDPASPWGVLGAHTARRTAFAPEDAHFLAAMAGLLATVIHRSRQEAEIGRLNRLYATLSAVNKAIVHGAGRPELFERICRAAVEEGVFAAALVTWSEDGTSPPAARAHWRRTATGAIERVDVAARCEVADRATRTGRPSFGDDPFACGACDRRAADGTLACAAVPLALHGMGRGAFAICATGPVVSGGGDADLLDEIASDISYALDRLEHEEERRRAEAALRESEARFRRLYEESPVGYQSLDPRGRVLDVNPAWLALLGYRREEVIGRHFGEFLTPESRAAFAERFPVFRERGSAHGAGFEMRTREGGTVSVSFDGVFVRDGEGKPAWTHCVMQDLTERRRAEEELRRMEARFHQAQKMESVGRLAGGVAHDFNNMLQVILSYAVLAEGCANPADRLRSYLAQIRRAAERSAELTQQLLAFARRQVIAPRVLELNGAIEGLLAMLRRLIGEDIRVDWLPDPDPWPVLMDPAQVGQVLTNLCVNARDAIGGVGRIGISVGHAVVDESFGARHPGALPGEYVRVDVADTGCGMDPVTLERIFEPFFTTKGDGHGTGLGLPTVYGIVTQNRGFLDVASEPGRGSTFSVYLPRYAGGAADAPEVTPTAGAAAERGGGETVLVVEDEPAILELTVEMLTPLGYRALGAGSPEAALARVASHEGSVDLLLTDVIMPGMNGRDLLARLRERHPGIRCLYMSGYTADVIARRGVLENATSFIQKPFTEAGLAAKVREVLHGTQG